MRPESGYIYNFRHNEKTLHIGEDVRHKRWRHSAEPGLKVKGFITRHVKYKLLHTERYRSERFVCICVARDVAPLFVAQTRA